jgi:hypothetical protein
LRTKAALAWIGITSTGWLIHRLPWREKKKEHRVQHDEDDYWLGALLEFVAGSAECDNISHFFVTV